MRIYVGVLFVFFGNFPILETFQFKQVAQIFEQLWNCFGQLHDSCAQARQQVRQGEPTIKHYAPNNAVSPRLCFATNQLNQEESHNDRADRNFRPPFRTLKSIHVKIHVVRWSLSETSFMKAALSSLSMLCQTGSKVLWFGAKAWCAHSLPQICLHPV